jgi:hypothetical protein
MYGIYENGAVIAKFVAPMRVVSNSPVFSTDTMSLKRSLNKRPAQRWEITTKLEPLSDDSNELFVLLTTKGLSSVLNITVPQNIGALRKRNVLELNYTASGGLNSSTISVATSSFIPKGTFIKFTNHSKIYMTTTDRSGSGTCGIFPELRLSMTNVAFNWREDVIMPVLLDVGAVIGMHFSDGILMDNGELTFVEAL